MKLTPFVRMHTKHTHTHIYEFNLILFQETLKALVLNRFQSHEITSVRRNAEC